MASKISIIIPSRNEEKFIGDCLNSVIANDYSKDDLEILIVDGASEDGTRDIIKSYARKYSFIKLFDNPKKIKAVALNIGIENSRGEYILIMDVHAGYEKDYLSKCVKYSKEYGVDNVGGILKTFPVKNTLFAKAIAISLSHHFGTGGSYFRMGADSPKEVDTVFGGCYKREVFDKIGLFNENLIRSQDIEFNLRLKRAGYKILLVPDIVVYYYPKENLKDFFWHNIEDGIWAILPLKFIKKPMKLRHYIPLIFILTLPLSIWLYIPLTLYFSMKIAMREKKIGYFFVMPIVFATRHIGYGLGSILGLIKLII